MSPGGLPLQVSWSHFLQLHRTNQPELINSHDLERALCRFWLRGMCAKHEACEFLHHLPKDVDLNSVQQVLSRANVPPGTGPLASLHPGPPVEDFPALGYEGARGGLNIRRQQPYNDPGRTRFAAAVKKPAPPPNGDVPGMRPNILTPSADNLHHQSAIVAPRPSNRIKLRSPALMPTLPTGDVLNNLYMNYRSRALQLGAARNACLSRAADAWRRGDGAAAKRFSREGHELNAKMGAEMQDAAGKLVRERARVAEQAVRSREASWSDDAGDRAARGKACGGGYGVILGVASRQVGDDKLLSSEERTEAMLDLHALHSNEANEVLEQFLLAVRRLIFNSAQRLTTFIQLEREHFLGLGECLPITYSARDANTCAYSLCRCRRRETYRSPRPCPWRLSPAPRNWCPRMAPSLGIPLERARWNHLHRPPLSPFRVSLNVVSSHLLRVLPGDPFWFRSR